MADGTAAARASGPRNGSRGGSAAPGSTSAVDEQREIDRVRPHVGPDEPLPECHRHGLRARVPPSLDNPCRGERTERAPRLRSRGVSKHQLTELAGGERVISERVPGVRSVALGFWIGAGSRDETDARAGVTHFIEHMLFKGSSRYSAQEIAEIFDELGGELNAATSRETTVVYARIPDVGLERALDVMADMVFRPTFTDVDSEREVVLEEIAMVEDTPNDLVHDIAAEAVFGRHPLGRPVIGRARHRERLAPRARRVPRPCLSGGSGRPRSGRERRPRRARRAASASDASARPTARACPRASRFARAVLRACASSARTRSSTTSA